jgi:hypothetical protein
VIETDGVATFLLSAALAAADLSTPKTLVLVGAPIGTGYYGGIAEPAFAAYALISAGATIGVDSNLGGIGGSIAPGATRRVIILKITPGSGTGVSLQVLDAAANTAAASTPSSAAMKVALGANQVGSAFGNFRARAVLLWAGATTPAQDAVIRDWAVANHGAVAL